MDSNYPEDDESFNQARNLNFMQWCIKGTRDSTVGYHFASVTDDDGEVSYYNLWGYVGDAYRSADLTNLLPTQ